MGNPVPVMINLIWNQISINEAQQMLYSFKGKTVNIIQHRIQVCGNALKKKKNPWKQGYKLGVISSANLNLN